MADEREGAVEVMEAHQDLVVHLERSARRMRALSLATVVVAAFFAFAYASQLLLALTGTKSVTVNLTDPANQLTEVVVLALALVWLYVGVSDYLFSTKVRRAVGKARTDETELKKRLPEGPSD